MEKQIKENKMGTMAPMRLLISMSLPIMVSMFIQALYNIVDSIYVSQYSNNGLAALSLAFPIQMLMSAVGVGTAVGTYSLISRCLGARRHEDAERAAGNGLTLATLSGLVFLVLGLLFTGPYMRAVSDNPETVRLGEEYLSIVTVYGMGVFHSVMTEKMLQATGKTTLSMITQIVGAATNIVLDPILIFGRYGFPELGVRGAAIATVIGQVLAMIAGIILVRRFNPELPVHFRHLRLRGETVRAIYVVGVPSIIMQAIGSLMTFLLNLILKQFSETAVSVLGAYFKLNSFVFMPIFGLNSGQTPIIGYNYGARKKERIYATLRSALLVGIAIMVVGTAVFELIPDRMFMLFGSSEELLAIGVPAFRIIGLCFIPASVSIVLSGVFQGIGVGLYSMINSILRQIVLLLPAAWLLATFAGLDYVWLAFPIAETISLVYMILMYRRADRKYISVL